MRSRMNLRKKIYWLALLPVLMGADGKYGQLRRALTVNSIPICADDEYLVYTISGLSCGRFDASIIKLPDCASMNKLLTRTLISGVAAFDCTDIGLASLSAGDISTINSTYQQLLDMETSLQALERGTTQRGAHYCGQTSVQTSAAFVDGANTGIAAAASLCGKVPVCGSTAHLCTVYEMYDSVQSGAITNNMTINKSWVYMANWSQEFSDSTGMQKDPGAGLADNCGSFTDGSGARKWYGTAVEWTVADSGQKALKFHSGPSSVGVPGTTSTISNPSAISCNTMLPIACCR